MIISKSWKILPQNDSSKAEIICLLNYVMSGKKGGKNTPKRKITITYHVPYLRNSKAYDHDLCYACVK